MLNSNPHNIKQVEIGLNIKVICGSVTAKISKAKEQKSISCKCKPEICDDMACWGETFKDKRKLRQRYTISEYQSPNNKVSTCRVPGFRAVQ